jgi:hypothetical protein
MSASNQQRLTAGHRYRAEDGARPEYCHLVFAEKNVAYQLAKCMCLARDGGAYSCHSYEKMRDTPTSKLNPSREECLRAEVTISETFIDNCTMLVRCASRLNERRRRSQLRMEKVLRGCQLI